MYMYVYSNSLYYQSFVTSSDDSQTPTAIWYNPVLAMHHLDKYKLASSNESVVEQFFNQLFSDADVFIGIHDKKVHIFCFKNKSLFLVVVYRADYVLLFLFCT